MKSTDYSEKTIGQMVAEDYRTADVFKKYGIDFCCGGKKKLQDVCESKGLDFAILEKDLVENEQSFSIPETRKFIDMEADELIEHILSVHHQYVRQNIPLLLEYGEKVSRVHGLHNPELIEINRIFIEVANELTGHMYKEEQILFPYILKLLSANRAGSEGKTGFENSMNVANPINMMEAEHEMVGNLLKEIQTLSTEYTLPEYACNTYRVYYLKLKEFQNDLHRHIHLENNILFPKALVIQTNLQ